MNSIFRIIGVGALIFTSTLSDLVTAQTPLPYYCPNAGNLAWLPTQPIAGQIFQYQIVSPNEYQTSVFHTQVTGFNISIEAESWIAQFPPVPTIGSLGPLPPGEYTVTLQMYYFQGGPTITCLPYVTTILLGGPAPTPAVPTPASSTLMLWAAVLLLAGVGVWRQRRAR